MEKKIKYILITTLTLSVFSCKEPELGETWRWTTKVDPFDKILKPYYDYKVLAKQDGYVEYLDVSNNSIKSMSIRMFKWRSECIKDCK